MMKLYEQMENKWMCHICSREVLQRNRAKHFQTNIHKRNAKIIEQVVRTEPSMACDNNAGG
jgi:hypothetical protein